MNRSAFRKQSNNGGQSSTSGIGMPKMLLNMDMFGEPLPGFNIEGRREVRTYLGGFVSFVIIYILFMFSVLKLQHLLSKHNPVVNSFVERDAFDDSDIWNGEEEQDFMMAFAV